MSSRENWLVLEVYSNKGQSTFQESFRLLANHCSINEAVSISGKDAIPSA
jgi:hypothetical protein